MGQRDDAGQGNHRGPCQDLREYSLEKWPFHGYVSPLPEAMLPIQPFRRGLAEAVICENPTPEKKFRSAQGRDLLRQNARSPNSVPFVGQFTVYGIQAPQYGQTSILGNMVQWLRLLRVAPGCRRPAAEPLRSPPARPAADEFERSRHSLLFTHRKSPASWPGHISAAGGQTCPPAMPQPGCGLQPILTTRLPLRSHPRPIGRNANQV